MRADLDRRGGKPAERVTGAGSVLKGVALLGSALALAMLTRHQAYRAQEQGRGPGKQTDPDRDDSDVDEETIPVLDDVVTDEELQRRPGEPPVLTDEVVPRRR
jgi:hypothetical protein